MDTPWIKGMAKGIMIEIDLFDEQCDEAQHTDTGEVWDLLYWIRKQAQQILDEAKTEEV